MRASFPTNEDNGIVKGVAALPPAILSGGGDHRSYNAGKLARNFLNSCLLFHPSLQTKPCFGLAANISNWIHFARVQMLFSAQNLESFRSLGT